MRSNLIRQREETIIALEDQESHRRGRPPIITDAVKRNRHRRVIYTSDDDEEDDEDVFLGIGSSHSGQTAPGNRRSVDEDEALRMAEMAYIFDDDENDGTFRGTFILSSRHM